MVLHTLNKSPEHSAFAQCIALIDKEDALLLIGDGVYAAVPNSRAAGTLANLSAAIYVLESDAIAAGLTTLPAGVIAVSIGGFVELTEQYPRQMAWY
jgi:tRNA 2-thiouridine synthesizing protein B